MKQSIRSRLVCLAAVALVFAFARNAEAAITVSVNSSPPSTDLLLSHGGVTNFASQWRWIGDNPTGNGHEHTDLGQSFLVPGASDVVLDKITIRPRDVGTAVSGASYNLEIWSFSDATDISGNSLVSSQTDVFPSSGLSSGYWTFDIEDQALASGQQYGFILAFNNGPDSQLFINAVEDLNGAYTDGGKLSREGTPPVWSAFRNFVDLDFYLQGSIIPEPSTLALTMLGMAGLGWRRRRRT